MIFCVFLPYFAASVEQQRNPDLSDEPLVLSDSTRRVRRIAAVSREAAQLDIRQGMVVRHAQILVPEIRVLPLHPPRYRQCLDELVDTFCTFTDRIETAYQGWGAGDTKIGLSVQSAAHQGCPAVAFLDVGTLKPQALYSLGQQLQNALQLQHYSAQVGIATNRFTAWVAAQAARDGDIGLVPEGEEAWMLFCHPVSLLPLDSKVLRRLGWLGIRTLGDFAGLPSTAMLTQFGKPGQLAYPLAHGIDPTPVRKFMREKHLHRSFTFEGAVADRQMVSAALKKLTGELVTSLEKSTETARKMGLTLLLDDNGAYELETRLRRRTYTALHLHHTLLSLLERAKVTAPIREMTVTFGDIVPRAPQQLELFPTMQLVDSRQAALDDLVARYGERFFTASVTDEQALISEHQIEFKAVNIA